LSDETWLPEWSAGLITLKFFGAGQRGMETAKFGRDWANLAKIPCAKSDTAI
jgi:hypothetical protein